MFYEAADILEYQQVEWKPRAYRKAAQMIENLGEDVEKIYERKGKGGLNEISGVGEAIADHIAEYLETGKVDKFEKLMEKTQSGTVELMEIRGLGAKNIQKLADFLGIKTLSDLENAIQAHKIRRLGGFGEKNRRKSCKGS